MPYHKDLVDRRKCPKLSVLNHLDILKWHATLLKSVDRPIGPKTQSVSKTSVP